MQSMYVGRVSKCNDDHHTTDKRVGSGMRRATERRWLIIGHTHMVGLHCTCMQCNAAACLPAGLYDPREGEDVYGEAVPHVVSAERMPR